MLITWVKRPDRCEGRECTEGLTFLHVLVIQLTNVKETHHIVNEINKCDAEGRHGEWVELMHTTRGLRREAPGQIRTNIDNDFIYISTLM